MPTAKKKELLPVMLAMLAKIADTIDEAREPWCHWPPSRTLDALEEGGYVGQLERRGAELRIFVTAAGLDRLRDEEVRGRVDRVELVGPVEGPCWARTRHPRFAVELAPCPLWGWTIRRVRTPPGPGAPPLSAPHQLVRTAAGLRVGPRRGDGMPLAGVPDRILQRLARRLKDDPRIVAASTELDLEEERLAREVVTVTLPRPVGALLGESTIDLENVHLALAAVDAGLLLSELTARLAGANHVRDFYWRPSNRDRFEVALCEIPPAARRRGVFLNGEPVVRDECGRHCFGVHRVAAGEYWIGSRPIAVDEFETLVPPDPPVAVAELDAGQLAG